MVYVSYIQIGCFIFSPVIRIPDETPELEATESEDLTYIEAESNHCLLLKSTFRNTFELFLIL